MSDEREKAIIEARAKDRLWMYWGPLVIAPIPYICVTLYRNAKTPRAKQILIGVGMIGVPIVSEVGRIFLLSNSSSDTKVQQKGANTMSLEQQSRLQLPRM